MARSEPIGWDYTAREQAERDVASTLRGVRGDRDIPRGILSDVVPPDAPDGADASEWLAAAELTQRIQARADIHTVTGRGGVRFIDVAATGAGLEAAITNARAELIAEREQVTS